MAASTTLLTDAQTMITNGPTANTVAAAQAAAGPIQDYVGNLYLLQVKYKECKKLLTDIKAATDAGDGNLTTINNDLLTFS